jgi:hypothetical protein
MKAEAEAAAAAAMGPTKGVVVVKPLTVPIPTPAPESDSAPASATTESQSMDMDMDEQLKEVFGKLDPLDEYEIDGVKQYMDDAAADAALADIAALVPLPTFEVKEISAAERERAKSMGIPDWLAHPTKIDPEINTAIDSPMFGFSSRLIKQCKKAGIQECFAVQTAVIPVLMRAKHLGDIRKAPGDLCVSAPTGSGKTLAYVLPIIEVKEQKDQNTKDTLMEEAFQTENVFFCPLWCPHSTYQDP